MEAMAGELYARVVHWANDAPRRCFEAGGVDFEAYDECMERFVKEVRGMESLRVFVTARFARCLQSGGYAECAEAARTEVLAHADQILPAES